MEISCDVLRESFTLPGREMQTFAFILRTLCGDLTQSKGS